MKVRKISEKNYSNQLTLVKFSYAQPVGNVNLFLRHDQDIYKQKKIFSDLCFEFDFPFEPKRILHIGAGIGFTTLFLERRFPEAEIACLEPMPQKARLLRRNLQINSSRAQGVEAALSGGDVEHVKCSSADTSKIRPMAEDEKYSDNKIYFQGVRMTTILSQLGWSQVDLVQFDVRDKACLEENVDCLRHIGAISFGFGNESIEGKNTLEGHLKELQEIRNEAGGEIYLHNL